MINFVKRTNRNIKFSPWFYSLLFLVSLWAVFLFPKTAISKCNVKGDGQIDLYNYHLDEHMVVTYKVNGSYNQEGLEKIYKIFRSPDGKSHPIPTQPIEIIDYIQDSLRIRTIEIISGYRSAEYNKGLKEKGKKVARESLHKLGKAVDIHIDEVTEEKLKVFAEKMRCGGVGYYPDHDFIHIDIGPVKKWGNTLKKRKLIGLKNNKSKNELITNKNDFLEDETIDLELKNNLNKNLIINRCVALEHFSKGKWINLRNILLGSNEKTIAPNRTSNLTMTTNLKDCNSKLIHSLPFGKYRIRMKTKPDNILSNEFYLKKF